MKKICIINGNSWNNAYNSIEKDLSLEEKGKIILLDYDNILKRIYYKSKIEISYNDWILSLTDKEKSDMFISEVLRRLENSEQENILINLPTSQVLLMKTILTFKDYQFKIISLSSTPELAYRNYAFENRLFISFEQFKVLYNEELEKRKNLDDSLRNVNIPFTSIIRNNNNDDFICAIRDFYNFENKDIKQEEYLWPIEPKYKVIEHDYYGTRKLHMITKKERFHSGFDITAKNMTPVKSSIGGVVIYSGLDERILSGISKWNERYGNMVCVLDNYGRVEVYAHLREITVNKNDIIGPNSLIGYSGCSGGARVPHLHFEIRNKYTEHSGKENTIDPLLILPERDFPSKHFAEEPYTKTWLHMMNGSWDITDDQVSYYEDKRYIR